MKEKDTSIQVLENNNTISKDISLCIECGECVKTCRNIALIGSLYDQDKIKKPICIGCGQCIMTCPTESLKEKFAYQKVINILKKGQKKVIFSIAPAVRVALGTEFGFSEGTNVALKIVTALKEMGAAYVFDITFGADLTIMEEAMELKKRIESQKNLPLFTSCCPAWVKFAEIFYPKYLKNLSTTLSPIGMQGVIIKNYLPSKIGLRKDDIIHVVVAPCTAKKEEIINTKDKDGYQGTDYILTTRELVKLIKEFKIDFKNLEESNFDNSLNGSGSGVIFGTTGGVCEAILRTTYRYMTNKDLLDKDLIIHNARGMNDIKELEVNFGNTKIKCAIVNGLNNIKKILTDLDNNTCSYDFIEVMTCNGGCIGGGGQPFKMDDEKQTNNERSNGLYNTDLKMTRRVSYKNKDILKLYQDVFQEPNSLIAQKYLHRQFEDKSSILRGE